MNAAIAAYAEGDFSVLDSSSLHRRSDRGPAIHVNAGRLWVQQDGTPALGVTAGERFVVPDAGPLSARGAARTHIELRCAGAPQLRS